MDKDTLWKTIKRINELSTLPEIYIKVSELINDPKSSAATLANAISRDPTLTVKLLKVANSPFYRASSIRITSITHAVAVLGFKAVANLVLTASIFDLFSDYIEDFKPTVEGIWKHSIACATGARVLAQCINYKEPEELFVAGLLHDIGKIAELQFMPDEFKQVLKLTGKSEILMGEAEEKIIGYSHTYVGRLLCKQWKLSPQIVASVEAHNTPEKATNFQTHVSIVHIADVFSYALSLGEGGSSIIPPLSGKVWESLNLRPTMIELILRRINKESKDTMEFFFPQGEVK